MTDLGIYELLTKIDEGYEPTWDEKEELNSIKSIGLNGIKIIPKCIGLLTGLTSLDLYWSSVRNISALSGLTALTNLKLVGTNVSDISALSGLTSLTSLSLSTTNVNDISALSGLTSLTSLSLVGTNVSDISALSGLTSLTSLSLVDTNVSDISALSGLTSLTSLSLVRTNVSDISALSGLTSLRSLTLFGTNVSNISALSGLTSLTSLDLISTNVSDISVLSGLTGLTKFNLFGTNVGDINVLSGLTGLTKLDLFGTNVSDISALSGLTSLTSLNLGSTNVSDISALSGLTSLTSLSLSTTNVSDISALRELTSLKNLDLRNLSINAIPEFLLDLQLDFILEYKNQMKQGIQIQGVTLKEQPIEIFAQSRELIRAYYRSQEKTPINECKVIFLGDGGAGKSLMIDRLMNDGEQSPDFDGESTPGIKITSKKYQIKGEEIELHFWDFGGQAIMHSMHRLFLTNRTLYVVVANARDNKANEQAWYWIRNIKSFANGASVLLLVNQKDQNPSANINETGLRKEYPEIKGVGIVSALKDSVEEFNKSIRDVICKTVSDMDSVFTPFPKSWLSLMNDLQEMTTEYIDSGVFYEKCRNNAIETQQEILDQILGWYQDLGVCFYSRQHPVARKYMVLKPRWILNAIYILAFNGRKYARNGIISENDIYKLICEPVPDCDVKKVWSEIKYQENEIQYIIYVLLNFNLVYRIEEGRYFVPMLCDESEPEEIGVYDDAIHVSFKYEYLPENVLHRLMVMHGAELNRDVVWKTGAVFEHKRCGWRALVRIRDNCLDVWAKSSDQETYPINVYLDLIRESVYSINSDFQLAADEYITYSRDGKTDEFEYQLLEDSRNDGFNEIYSRVFRSQLNIDEIIGVMKSPNQIQPLLGSVSDALLRLQRNKDFYGAEENACNKYVRDLLEAGGYTCKDQTLRGLGSGRKSDGELDILIQDRESGEDLAIYEALKLGQKTFAGSDQKYLAGHLKKLLDNYNPTGFTNLLLVSYVAWDKERFHDLAEKYMEYVLDKESAPYEILQGRMTDHSNSGFMRCYKVGYDCGGTIMYVYHFVVRVAG